MSYLDQFAGYLEPVDVSEAFDEMGLDFLRVLGLGENVQQFFVAQKVQAREDESLGLEVLLKNRRTKRNLARSSLNWPRRMEEVRSPLATAGSFPFARHTIARTRRDLAQSRLSERSACPLFDA